MNAPSSIRLTDAAFKALKVLETTTQKKRVVLLSEALVEKANNSAASPIIRCRLLDPSEILTLQSEIAALEKLHQANRRTLKIRTGDKDATAKIIKAVDKIDAETDHLQALRVSLANLGTAAEIVSAGADVNDSATKIASLVAKIEAEAEQLRQDLRAKLAASAPAETAGTNGNVAKLEAEVAQLRAQLAASARLENIVDIVAEAETNQKPEIERLIKWAMQRLSQAKPDQKRAYELELKLLQALFL